MIARKSWRVDDRMALLASSWLIIESFIIPYGFLKWFYLSFYIHPFFLMFCQIFLWFKELQRWIFLLFHFTLKIANFPRLFIFKFLNKFVIFFFSFIRSSQTKVELFYDAMELEEIIPQIQDHEVVVFSTCSPFQVANIIRSQVGVFDPKNESKVCLNLDSCTKDSWLDEYLSSDYFTSSILATESMVSSNSEQKSCSIHSSLTDQDVDFQLQHSDIDSFSTTYLPQSHEGINGFLSLSEFTHDLDENSEIRSSQSCEQPQFVDEHFSVKELQQQLISTIGEENIDQFQQKYKERMRFFDVLYEERLYGMNMISTELHMTCPKSPAKLSMQYISWNKMARKRLLRSLECDFELIYVAQLCLFWEAILHEYHKVETFVTFSDRLFHHSILGKFQELQILLERFVEGQKFENQTSSNITHERLKFQCLLQVPNVAGFMEDENNMGEETMIRATQVLKAIEKCMEVFWIYVERDDKKSLWKYKGIWRSTHPPLEDPLDLELLFRVSKALYKKGIMLKDVQGKKKCWMRGKVKPLEEEDEKRNLLFAMVEMKLIQRLLKMPLISTNQLNWCQDKLNNLEFKHGKVFMGTKTHLFPSI